MTKKIENLKPMIFLAVIVLLCLLFPIFTYLRKNNENNDIKPDLTKINLNGYNKVMIVAHPVDESLWGGEHLIKHNYLVVCITCGSNRSEKMSFVNVMRDTENSYIMLGYPEYTNNEKDSWDNYVEDIEKDLKEILKLKDWEQIAVHNPDGEYGDKQHKVLSKLVTNLVEDKDKLYYFAKYINKKDLSKYYDSLSAPDYSTISHKKKLIGLYKSNDYIQTSFSHMFPYENWLSYKEWGELDEN